MKQLTHQMIQARHASPILLLTERSPRVNTLQEMHHAKGGIEQELGLISVSYNPQDFKVMF